MRNFLSQFFVGRYGAYGTDQMNKFILIIAVIFLVLSYITPFSMLYWVAFALLGYAYFRLFSKNIPKRYHENESYMKIQNKVTGFFKNFTSNIEQRKAYHIYKCPNCAQKIRIPRGKGNIVVRCPKCHTEFQKRS
ncbi:MAG: zinc-ribbon domain-containing protein [Butyrivibrio sp.]|nr:zinc-ribbon domain-containing protein [Butyrivibrio sp.]